MIYLEPYQKYNCNLVCPAEQQEIRWEGGRYLGSGYSATHFHMYSSNLAKIHSPRNSGLRQLTLIFKVGQTSKSGTAVLCNWGSSWCGWEMRLQHFGKFLSKHLFLKFKCSGLFCVPLHGVKKEGRAQTPQLYFTW